MLRYYHLWAMRIRAIVSGGSVSASQRYQRHQAKRRTELLQLVARHEAEVLHDLANDLMLRAQAIVGEASEETVVSRSVGTSPSGEPILDSNGDGHGSGKRKSR